MRTFPSIESKASPMNIIRLWSFLRRLALALVVAAPLVTAATPQETFATPEAAVDALMAALKADSDPAMAAIFGEEHKDLVIQSDRAASSATRAKILAAMQTLRVLQAPSQDRRVLLIGDEAWPVPIPLVRTGDRWRFATEEGEDEIINRRIGGNERNAIYVLHAYIDAQRDRYGVEPICTARVSLSLPSALYNCSSRGFSGFSMLMKASPSGPFATQAQVRAR